MRHVNIPVFIPHLGCPNQCVFCNQRTISGVGEFRADDVIGIIDRALLTIEEDVEVEIAFFGGSFTGIDRELMISLLEIGYSYIEKGRVSSLRCSTRPDYIDIEILEILRKYGVKTIELGLQSTSDKVLEKSKRGHNFEAEQKSCLMIVDHGFNLVGQMMIGLPGADPQSEIDTAEFIISAGASGARIYPTVVFKDTELACLCRCGEYEPLSIDEAIARSSAVLERFIDAGVEVIRIGLQASENLSDEDTYLAGPNHSALGELVIGEVYYNKICKKLAQVNAGADDNISVSVARGSLSKAVGQSKRNKRRLSEKYKSVRFTESDKISSFEVLVDIKNGENKCT